MISVIKGHHGDHRAVGEKLGAHQVGVGTVEPLFLKGLAAEGADRHNAGQNLAADKVQPIYKVCICLNLGMATFISTAMSSSSATTATKMIHVSPVLPPATCRMPPMPRIGA